MILARNFTRLPASRCTSASTRPHGCSGRATLAYLTLTNDHQPRTEGAHDHARMGTVERVAAAAPGGGGAARVLGPPRRNGGGAAKGSFAAVEACAWTGEPYARFALPCATADADDAGGGRYGADVGGAGYR